MLEDDSQVILILIWLLKAAGKTQLLSTAHFLDFLICTEISDIFKRILFSMLKDIFATFKIRN